MLKPCWETGGSGQAVDFQPCSKSLQPKKTEDLEIHPMLIPNIWQLHLMDELNLFIAQAKSAWIGTILTLQTGHGSIRSRVGVCDHQGTLQNLKRISIPEYWERTTS